jgi:hypothetical protein
VSSPYGRIKGHGRVFKCYLKKQKDFERIIDQLCHFEIVPKATFLPCNARIIKAYIYLMEV